MASSPPPPRPRYASARRGLTGLTLAGAAALVAGLLGPASASADDAFVSDADTSSNVTHVTNVPKTESMSDFNSDLAFTGDYAIGGNYNGFVVYDISEPEDPQVVSEVLCPGGQGDVSVSGD
ncbi:hypothetical protein ACFQBR_33495, partial [Nocardiopsis tropica]